MKNIADVSAIELGRHLTRVREQAGIKQAELARRVTWSPAVLSRVENGERELGTEELETILNAIDTVPAAQLRIALDRSWQVLPRPSLDHPDQDLLWSAEEVAQQLADMRRQPDVRQAFDRRLAEYVEEISAIAALLLKRDHRIAFIGSIGIGKSTAICRVVGLEVSVPDSPQLAPVLEIGAGGVTICEAHLRSGPGYGLLIDPRQIDEIRADVTDFAEHIMATTGVAPGTDADSQGISKEIERAIRNLAGLRVRREKSKSGKVVRHDEAKELAKAHPSVRELVVEILSRMELHRRDRRDVWYDASTGHPPLVWLKDIFEKVNNGRHHEFALPKRIEVVVPEPLLDADGLSVRFVDTRGIDRTAARADLEGHLDDPHTLAVLCSGFNNAPATEARLLLERARDAGVGHLVDRASLLVLPRPNEAMAVKDESGVRVDTVEEGYDIKSEQVAMNLQSLKLGEFVVGFFNAYEDSPVRLRSYLTERLRRVRETFRVRLVDTVNSANALLQHHEEEQVQAVMRHAATMLKTWVSENTTTRRRDTHVQDSLLNQIKIAHPSTIRASVRRDGDWYNLNYVHHLGYGGRRVAVRLLGRSIDGLAELCRTLAANPEYADAKDLILQVDSVLRSAYEELLRKVQLRCQTSYGDALKRDTDFWERCRGEWGRGSGYRDRVATRSRTWCREDAQRRLEREVGALIQQEWNAALARITGLLETDS